MFINRAMIIGIKRDEEVGIWKGSFGHRISDNYIFTMCDGTLVDVDTTNLNVVQTASESRKIEPVVEYILPHRRISFEG